MLWKAREKKKISIDIINPREFSADKHKKVDSRPYGGGPGMVLMAAPILKATKRFKIRDSRFMILSPRGKQFDNKMAARLAKEKRQIVLIAGHYEGIDARVKKILKAEEISVGPYILTGGELPAMIIVDAVTRQVPGVLGHHQSLEELRISTGEVYARPEVLTYKGRSYRVPKILLSGHRKNIEEWKSRH
jgi:tRNA (guanine37-N1)-methyltransferase